MRFVLTSLLFTVLATSAHAGDISAPPGFNTETVTAAGPLAKILPDGTVLIGTGVFLADELSVLHPDGTVTLFATGYGDIAGIAQDPISGDIIVGDSEFSPSLHVLRDLNSDGDMLDPGEDTAHPAVLPVLSNGGVPLPFLLEFKPGTSELFMTGSTHFSIFPPLGVVLRIVGGTASIFADGMTFPADMLWDDDTMYVADAYLTPAFDFFGRVVTLEDGNADDDALDPSETVVFADGLGGASGLVLADDGSFYLSGVTDPLDFSSAIARLLPDDDDDGISDGVTEIYFDGFGFSAGLTLIEGESGFLPGAVGDGELLVEDFGVGGWTVLRSAPRAELTLTGTVANNSVFTLDVAGEAGAVPLIVLSLDQVGITLPGVGDLSLGFGLPNLILNLPVIGGSGSSALSIALHDVGGAVGLALSMQAFTVEAGKIGISNAIDVVIAP
jgi:hypothetical protein